MPLDGDITKFEPKILSLDGLISWLETQPAAGQYSFEKIDGSCLIGQYLKAKGLDMRSYCDLADQEWSNSGLSFLHYLPTVRVGTIACHSPRTFGAALSRAIELRGKL
jgi:hypothetical protein